MDAITKASFWTDSRVEALTKDEKLAVLWLISNPSRDICGFTAVSNKRFTFETELEPSTLQGACKGLAGSIREVSVGVWFMVNFLRHQFGKGGKLSLGNKVVIAAARHASKLPNAQANAFFEAYPELRELGLDQHLRNSKMEGGSKPHTAKRDGVREGEGEGAEKADSFELEDQAGRLCLAHPAKALTRPALEAARAAIKKHSFEKVMAGTKAYADAVAGWTPMERANYVKNPEAFFRDDLWNQAATNWGSKVKAKQTAAVVDLEAAKQSLGRRAAHIS